MSDTEKILILHDTNMFEVDPNFSRWVMDFKANVIEAQNRIPGSNNQLFLSLDFSISPDQPVQIHPGDFNSFIVLLTDDINRTRNLKNQFEQVFDMSGDAGKNPPGKKVLYIMLGEFTIDYYMLQVPDKKIFKFYKQGNVDIYNPRNVLGPQDRDYWLKLMEILEFLSRDTEEDGTDIQLIPSQVIVYIGQGSPDLEDKRDQLISEMKRRAMRSIPELMIIPGGAKSTE